MSNFCNNIILSAPYFQQKPGSESNNEQILFDYRRQEKLLKSINKNKKLRIQIYCGENDSFRNSCYVLCFWLKGNMTNVRICEIKDGQHDDSFHTIFGSTNVRSRLREFCTQVDKEMGLRPHE